jgi:hypothetical protein
MSHGLSRPGIKLDLKVQLSHFGDKVFKDKLDRFADKENKFKLDILIHSRVGQIVDFIPQK